jgi:ubiquinone/menaquinone biosynthesis C-methylase UbiE
MTDFRNRTARVSLTPPEAGAYFDALYSALANSPTHALVGREAVGEAYVGQLGYAGEEELFRLAELAGIGRGRRVLELCCGTGGVSVWFARQTGSSVIGVDCSRVGLSLSSLAVQGAPEVDAEFVLGDIDHLPFAQGRFDAVVCLDGFGALFSKIFRECYRVLRPGGGLAFMLNVPRTPEVRVETELSKAGFVDTYVASEQSHAVMRRWLAAYKRYATSHIDEIGMAYHVALTEEIASLLDHFAKGGVKRYLISAVKPLETN